MVNKVKEIAEEQRDEQIEVVRGDMVRIQKKFELYSQLVAEEVKVNEFLR
jgi:hypothetical protein